MAKYIDSGAFQAALVRKKCGPANQRYTDGWNDCLMRVKSMVSKAPAADVAPVVHGRWNCVYDDSTGETNIACSHCKNTRTVNGCFVSTDGKSCYFEDDYCPNCGAKMDGGDSDVRIAD